MQGSYPDMDFHQMVTSRTLMQQRVERNRLLLEMRMEPDTGEPPASRRRMRASVRHWIERWFPRNAIVPSNQ
jgi:hypothetical protein